MAPPPDDGNKNDRKAIRKKNKNMQILRENPLLGKTMSI